MGMYYKVKRYAADEQLYVDETILKGSDGLVVLRSLIFELDWRALLLEPRLEHICAQSDACTAVLRLVAGAQEFAVRASDILARLVSRLTSVQPQRCAAPAFLSILNTSKVVAGLSRVALLQTLSDSHVSSVVVYLRSQETALVRLREAAIVGVVDVSLANDRASRRGRCRSGGAGAGL